MDIAQIGVAGIYAATDRFEQSARRTVGADADLVAETAQQISSKHAFEASVLVVKTGDEMMKRLLDIKV